jgi:hypothetical protein
VHSDKRPRTKSIFAFVMIRDNVDPMTTLPIQETMVTGHRLWIVVRGVRT